MQSQFYQSRFRLLIFRTRGFEKLRKVGVHYPHLILRPASINNFDSHGLWRVGRNAPFVIQYIIRVVRK